MNREPMFQVYLYKGKRFVIRSATKNAYEPSPAQREVREVFKRIAKESKGMRMTEDMPPASILVKQRMKGYKAKSEKRKKEKVWQKEMREYVQQYAKEKADEVLRRLGIAQLEETY